MNGTAAEILARNLKALKDASLNLKGPQSIQAAGGPKKSSVNRIENKEQSPTIDMVSQLARVFGLQPWQILVPTLHAASNGTNHPTISGMPGWPFDKVPRARYEALEPADQIFLQGIIMATIQRIEDERPKKKLGRVK